MDLYKVFGFLFLCGLGLNSYAAEECMKAFGGGDYTITLDSPRQARDMLEWKHNHSIPLYHKRKSGKTTNAKAVNDKGDLVLKNVTFSNSGTYEGIHHNKDGAHIKTTTKKLCVIPKAPVPTLDISCSSSGEAILQCQPQNITGFSISWMHNNTEMTENINPLKLNNSAEEGPYKCRLTNDEFDEDTEDSTAAVASCSDECMKILEGRNYTISLNSPAEDGDTLVWKDNEGNVVYHRQNGSVIMGDDEDVDDSGSLYLENVNPSMSGMYTAKHHDNNGRLMKIMTRKLCVITKVPVPKLVVTCSASGAVLQCNHDNIPGFSLSWVHNNREMTEDVENPLHLTELRENNYRCRLTSDVFEDYKEDSNEVSPTVSCPDAAGPPAGLSGVVQWILISAALLVLIIILATVISCKYCHRENRGTDIQMPQDTTAEMRPPVPTGLPLTQDPERPPVLTGLPLAEDLGNQEDDPTNYSNATYTYHTSETSSCSSN